MEKNSDPFASITALCHITSSQEHRLNHSRFALESPQSSPPEEEEQASAPGDFPVASTGIVMVSPPETPEEAEHRNDDNTPKENPDDNNNNQEDVFHTPPEEAASQAASVDDCRAEEDGVGAETDRDRDGDEDGEVLRDEGLGGVHDKEVIHCEEMGAGDGLCEYSAKRLKVVSGANLGFLTPNPSCSRGEKVEDLGRLVKSEEKLRSRMKRLEAGGDNNNNRARLESAMELLKSPLRKLESFYENLVTGSSRGSLGVACDGGGEKLGEGTGLLDSGVESLGDSQGGEVEMEMEGGDEEVVEESPAKRELKFSTEVVESVIEGGVEVVNNQIEGSEANGLENASVDDSDKQCSEKEKNADVKRALPASFGFKENESQREVEHDSVLPQRNVRNGNVGRGEMGADDVSPRANVSEVTLLDVLRVLGKDYTYDASLDKLSIVEVAKRRGITFP